MEVPTLKPVVPATPAPAAPATPEAPVSRPVPAANAEQQQLGLADALYSRQQWDGAIPEYQRFLSDFPRAAETPAALYRLAECYLKMGNTNSARLYWSKLAALPQPGPIGGGAAYKLAEFEFKDREFAEAAAHFKLASQLLPDAKAKQSAQYFSARSYQELGRKPEARALYQTLADAPEKHPFRDSSQFQLGLLLQEAGRPGEALARFEKLSNEAGAAEIRAESTARSALLLLEANQPQKALQALEAALASKEIAQWHKVLQLGVFKAHVALGNNQQIIDAYPAAAASVEAPQLPELQLLAANAHKALKQHREAVVLYSQVVENAPDSLSAASARYDRLVCYYNLERPDLAQEIETFLATKPKALERDNALLMKAEWLRLKGDYAGAGGAYAQVVKSKDLKPDRRNDALMRWAECGVRTGDAESTVAATGELMAAAPNHPLAATALFWRAESLRKLKKYAEAEKGYETLSKRFPNSTDREMALKQWALLRGEQSDNVGMAQRFEQLLKEYPESKDAPEAHHWIGRSYFEAKDYKKAVPHLEKAREQNAEYFESDSLRLVYCAYNLNDPDEFWVRVQQYLPKGKNKITPDLLRWCAQIHLDAKSSPKAEPVLALLCSGEEVTENDWLQLANARYAIDKHAGAVEAATAYLGLVSHPASKARGLLVRAKAELALDNAAAAQKTADEVLRLQPEGILNGEARIVAGDILASQKSWEAAAKTYESVSIAFDEEQLAPPAMEKAYQAYRSAGKLKESQSVLNRLQSRYPEYARERALK
jgi:tetratricopeptide (TPR) repeat protein